MLNRTCQKLSDSAVECKGRLYQVKVMRSFTKEAACAKIGKEIWKQSSLGIPGTNWIKAFTEDYLNSIIGSQCLIHIDYLCGAASSVMLARTQKILLKG